MKRIQTALSLSLSLLLACLLLLGACAGGGGNNNAGSGTPGGQGAATGLRIGILTTSGVDDGSFGQDCYNGILAFISNNPGATVTPITEPDNSRVVDAVADVIADYDVLVLPGFQFSGAGAVAANNPDKKIILVDTPPQNEYNEEVELPNIYAMLFREEESGFFAGVAAALETNTGKVAVVNGIAFPPNVNYQFGFMAGVNYAVKHFGATAEYIELPSYADTDVTGRNVGGNYIGHFADEAAGKVLGNALIDQGVDILFVAAGASGNGVFAAAKEASNIWVIGCDVDQFDDGFRGDSNIVLTSALKVMSLNVTRQLEAIQNGTFQGKNEALGADTDSTGFVSTPGRHQLGQDTLARLDEVFQLIHDGGIVPPSNFNGHAPTDFPGL